MPSYVARPHVLAGEFVPGYLGDRFGFLPFVHGDPLANQFDGPFLVRLIRKEVTHTSGFPLGIESRDPDIPSCWHAGTMGRSCCWSIPCHNQAEPPPGSGLNRALFLCISSWLTSAARCRGIGVTRPSYW